MNYLSNNEQSSQSQYSLDSGFYLYFTTNVYSAGTKLKFTIAASATLDVYVMDSSQYGQCCYSGSQNNPSLSHWAVISGTETYTFQSSGLYYLVIQNDLSTSTVNFDLAYATVPVDIHQIHNAPPAPIGIADYGVIRSAGHLVPYEEIAQGVTGAAIVNSIAAHNNSVPEGSNPYGASLQLNVMLEVNTTRGQFDYWLQNVLTFDTNNGTGYWVSNIHNDTSQDASIDQSSISGAGSVQPGFFGNFYGFESQSFVYSTPLIVQMPIVVSHSDDNVDVRFGNDKGAGGLPLAGTVEYYDLVTIAEHATIQDAAIKITGYLTTPKGSYFDSEYVFGGDMEGAVTTFQSMDSEIGMYYTYEDGHTSAPKAVYGFGSNTGEAAYSIQTSLNNGTFHVGLGVSDFQTNYLPPQYAIMTFSYTTSDGSSMASSPQLHFIHDGTPTAVSLSSTPTTFGVDYGTDWSVTGPPNLRSGERYSAVGLTSGTSVISQTVTIRYTHQYLFTTTGVVGKSTADWYNAGSSMTLSVPVPTGWKFQGWAGTGDGSYSGPLNSTTITLNGPVTENASIYVGLSISVGKDGSVSYSDGSLSGSIPAGSVQTIYIPPGSVVSLTATPSSNYDFNGWKGMSNSTSGTIQVTMEDPSSLQASFNMLASGNIVDFIVGSVVILVVLAGAVLAILRSRRRKGRRPSDLYNEDDRPQDSGTIGSVSTPERVETFPESTRAGPSVAEQRTAPSPLPQGGMAGFKHCSACGTRLRQSAHFCNHCGMPQTRLDQVPPNPNPAATATTHCSFCQVSSENITQCELCQRTFCHDHANPFNHECTSLSDALDGKGPGATRLDP